MPELPWDLARFYPLEAPPPAYFGRRTGSAHLRTNRQFPQHLGISHAHVTFADDSRLSGSPETQRFNSAGQFKTTVIAPGAEARCSAIRNFEPSRETM